MNRTIRIKELTDIEIEGIDLWDYPDLVDAFIASAAWRDTGIELTEDELEQIDPDEAYELIHERAFDRYIR